MLAFVKFAMIANETVVERIFEQILVVGNGKHAVSGAFEAKIVDFSPDLGECEVTCGICFEGFLHQWRFNSINDDILGLFVVQISKWRFLRPDAVLQFLSVPTFDVLREVVHIVFRL
ncbi:MAG: hypothetical protein ABSF56_02270 [Minisyncoccia bacterium]